MASVTMARSTPYEGCSLLARNRATLGNAIEVRVRRGGVQGGVAVKWMAPRARRKAWQAPAVGQLLAQEQQELPRVLVPLPPHVPCGP